MNRVVRMLEHGLEIVGDCYGVNLISPTQTGVRRTAVFPCFKVRREVKFVKAETVYMRTHENFVHSPDEVRWEGVVGGGTSCSGAVWGPFVFQEWSFCGSLMLVKWQQQVILAVEPPWWDTSYGSVL